MENPNFERDVRSPEARAKAAHTRTTRLRTRALTKRERKFIDVYINTGSPRRAGESVGMKSPDTHSQIWLKKPLIAETIEKIKERSREKFVEKASDKVAAMLDIADERLLEILAAKRGIATPETVIAGHVPVEDAQLLKAVDLAYKRKGAYPSEKASQNNTINGTVNVYQSAWMKPSPQLSTGDTQ